MKEAAAEVEGAFNSKYGSISFKSVATRSFLFSSLSSMGSSSRIVKICSARDRDDDWSHWSGKMGTIWSKGSKSLSSKTVGVLRTIDGPEDISASAPASSSPSRCPAHCLSLFAGAIIISFWSANPFFIFKFLNFYIFQKDFSKLVDPESELLRFATRNRMSRFNVEEEPRRIFMSLFYCDPSLLFPLFFSFLSFFRFF